MASSHVLSVAGPLIVPELNAPQQGGALDQAPLSPARSALSPVRPASPSLHSVSLRAQPLSPTRLMPALALPSQATASLESLSLGAALDQPPALHGTPGEHILGGHPAHVIGAVSAEGLASAHILITAVALLNSAPDTGATSGGSQLPQGESAQGAPSRESAEADVELAVSVGTDATSSNEEKQRMKAGPWWLTAEGGDQASIAEGVAGASWWARQVEAARAEDRAQEGRALQESLHRNKGPDAPYALEGADPLLGAASPSLGEEDSGGAWWSQLTKIPTADWLHLNPRQTPDSNAAETSVEGDAVKSNSSGPKEEPTSVNGAEVPAVADVDREGFSTFSFESNGAALSVSEGEVVTPPSEYEVEAQPPLDVPQNLALSVEAGIAETVASAVGLESQARGELEDLLAFLPADSQSTDAGTRNTESALALSTEVPAGVIEPPPSLQVSEVTPEEQSNLEVDSPHTGLAEAETQPPVEGAPVVDSPVSADFIDQVSVDPLNIPAAAATLAPAQLPPAPLETATDGVLGEAPEKQAHIAVVEATPSESSEVMRKQRAAVEEARARLETIKAWRNSRAAMPPLTVSVPPPPVILPVLSGLPSPTLRSGIFPTRGSPLVATAAKPDGSIWKTLQELEWATEETADTFGRSSVAVHLAERHDGEHA